MENLRIIGYEKNHDAGAHGWRTDIMAAHATVHLVGLEHFTVFVTSFLYLLAS
jgi:hypothetical protein